MNENTATPGQASDMPAGPMTAGEASQVRIERFAIYGLDISSAIHFESTGDIGVVLTGSCLSDTYRIDVAESQVLIRANIDGEDAHLVYVDSGIRDRDDDLGTVTRAIAVLEQVRARLQLLIEAGR